MINFKINDLIKVIFHVEDTGDGCTGERLWVTVTKICGDKITGRIENIPIVVDFEWGDTANFNRQNVIEISLE